MINKILRFELLGLFLLTLNALLVFYLSDSLPDNIFTVSSRSDDFSYVSYYLFSLLNGVYYFTGPWIIIAFGVFSAVYVFAISRIESKWNALLIVPIIISTVLISYGVSEDTLGSGLRYVVATLFAKQVYALSLGLLLAFIILAFKFKKINFEKMFSIIPRRLPSLSFSFPRFELKSLFRRLNRKATDSALKQAMSSSSAEVAREDNSVQIEFEENFASREEPVRESETKKRILSLKKKQETTKEKTKPTQGSIDDAQYMQIVSTMSHKKGSNNNINPDEKYFTEIIQRIEEKLNEFKIEGKVINVLKGPVVDTFELELGAGVKVSKVTSASEDLSLALYGAPIRIVYPMKGRTTIGIEVPRNPREIIYLDEVFNSKEYKNSTNILPLAMGKDAFGEVFVVDLASMPHMLIAGATGAGKSVFINTLLVSLLAKKSPRQMKLILIDPKQLELALYANLPHLVVPVITDAKTAAYSLMWASQEMERRYSILKEFGVRNIDGFNQKLKRADSSLKDKIKKHYDYGERDLELPYLVIIVDEFADLILTKAGKEIENNICRLAAKARAAGIHLVLATQRPSVDVITGLIKSNFPTRVSFRVTTSVDSRTILNAIGAEKLLGKGDMLYKHGVETMRVHSAYVDEDEIEILTNKLSSMEPTFDEKAVEFIENEGMDETDPYSFGSNVNGPSTSSTKDNLFDQAVQVVMEHRSASASMLQRRLKIGYNRAANLIDELEAKGIVGPAQGSKPRKILGAGE